MKVFLITLFFLHLCGYSQSYISQKTIHDYNEDGEVDTLFYEQNSGSWFSSRTVNWVDGETGQKVRLGSEYYYGSFIGLIPLEKFWDDPEWVNLRDTMESRLLHPARFSTYPNPSLQWSMDVRRELISVDDSSIFDRVWNNMVRWRNAENVTLDYYYTQIDAATYASLSFDTTGIYSGAWLFYTGHNHLRGESEQMATKLFPAERGFPYDLYRTHHGVFMVKVNRVAWLFTGDSFTGYGGRLRNASIQKVARTEKGIFILVNGGIENENHLWWVDMKRGNLKRMRNQEKWGEIENFTVLEEGIQLNCRNKDLDEEGQETLKWSFFH